MCGGLDAVLGLKFHQKGLEARYAFITHQWLQLGNQFDNRDRSVQTRPHAHLALDPRRATTEGDALTDDNIDRCRRGIFLQHAPYFGGERRSCLCF